MLQMLINLGFKHLPKPLAICGVIALATFYITDVIRVELQDMNDNISYQSRQPFYLFTKYQLNKQAEKAVKDPGDIKVTDIEFLYIQCTDEFGSRYIPSLPPNERLTAENGCTQMKHLYANNSKPF